MMTRTTDWGLSIRASMFEHVDWRLGPLLACHNRIEPAHHGFFSIQVGSNGTGSGVLD